MKNIDDVYDCIRAYKRSRMLATCLHSGIFSFMREFEHPISISYMSQRLSFSPNWLLSIMHVLFLNNLVTEFEQGYMLTELGKKVADDSTLKSFADYHLYCYEAWNTLPQAMRSSQGNNFHRGKMKDKNFCRDYLLAMSAISQPQLDFLVETCEPLLTGKILDVGAGPAVISRKIAEKFPDRKVTAIDFPEIVAASKELFGESQNVNWVSGDFLEIEFSTKFSSIFVGHLLEYLPESEIFVWLKKLKELLEPGGILVVVLFLTQENRKGGDALALFEISTGLNGPYLGKLLNPESSVKLLEKSGLANTCIRKLTPGPSYSEYLIVGTNPKQMEQTNNE